jgi:phosphoribosyl-AMP cyclohydrolase
MLDPKEIEDVRVKLDSDPAKIVLPALKYNEQGLIPVVAQCYETGDILMVAWMNEETMRITLAEGKVCYWSRSRKEVWRKGATSGEWQILKEMSYDCDKDCIVVKVIQEKGKACHTGKRSCFSWLMYKA